MFDQFLPFRIIGRQGFFFFFFYFLQIFAECAPRAAPAQ